MPEFTKIAETRPNPVPPLVWIVFGGVVILVYFFGLTIPLLGPDEARYAQVAREMYERGDWLTPTLGGYNWFEKPVLLYWLQIVSYKLFGVSEFAARFGSALFGLGTVASLWFLGRSLTTEKAETTEKTIVAEQPETVQLDSVLSVSSAANSFASYLALIAASTLGILVFSRGASFDIIITFPLTAALVSFYIFDQAKVGTSRQKYFPLLLFYVFIGIALLAKGLVGLVFPLSITGLFYLLSRRWPCRIFLFSLVWGTLLALALASIWYLPMFQRHGYGFINEFFIQHHFQRFTSNKYQHPQPFYFFFWVLPLMTLPWTPLLFAVIWREIKKIVRRLDPKTHIELRANVETNTEAPPLPGSSSPLLLFSIAWLIVPLGFFSFSGSKLPGYILPSVPAAMILTSIFTFDLVRRNNKWRIAVLSISGLMFAGIIFLLTSIVPKFADGDSVKSLIAAADARGYTSSQVLTLHTVSHNAEFYAAGRLLRDEAGKQRRLSTNDELLEAITAGGSAPVVVLVPLEYLSHLTRDERVKTELLADNGELAVLGVAKK